MAFPTVTEFEGGGNTGNVTSHDVNLPSASPGDLILVAYSNDDEAQDQTWIHDQGFTDLAQVNNPDINSRLKYLVVGGTLDTVITITTPLTESRAWSVLHILADEWYGDPATGLAVASWVDGNTSMASPPLTPSWGVGDTLWLTIKSIDVPTATQLTTPTGYTMFTNHTVNNNQAVDMQVGWKNNAVATETPTPWTWNAARVCALYTVAIRAAVEAAPIATAFVV